MTATQAHTTIGPTASSPLRRAAQPAAHRRRRTDPPASGRHQKAHNTGQDPPRPNLVVPRRNISPVRRRVVANQPPFGKAAPGRTRTGVKRATASGPDDRNMSSPRAFPQASAVRVQSYAAGIRIRRQVPVQQNTLVRRPEHAPSQDHPTPAPIRHIFSMIP